MSHFVKIINVIINNQQKKQLLKCLSGGRVNCPIGVSLQCTRCHWAVLPVSRLAGVIITEATLITLSVTRADIFALIEASTGIKFSFGSISKLLNIRNFIWTQTKKNP